MGPPAAANAEQPGVMRWAFTSTRLELQWAHKLVSPEEAPDGESMSFLGTREGYRLWASTYDSYPNPLLALEQRIAAPLLGSLKGSRVIDICAGTGRWMLIAARMRASVIGLDLSPEMLGRAAEKPGLAGRLAIGDIAHLPFANTSADLAICSFGMSYVTSVQQALREMARVSRRVMISDMHPAALDSGWTRSFETACRKYRIAHYLRYPLAGGRRCCLRCRTATGMQHRGSPFGEPEHRIFEQAGKQARFEEVSQIPADLREDLGLNADRECQSGRIGERKRAADHRDSALANVPSGYPTFRTFHLDLGRPPVAARVDQRP